jgi:hypothetical protein
MPWSYSQSSGALSHDGVPVGTGYSGNGEGLDNPHLQDVPDEGPIPEGIYAIGPASTHPGKGQVVMALRPDPANRMFRRSGFLIHGDNANMNHTASEGCIILSRSIRNQIDKSEDRVLVVTT